MDDFTNGEFTINWNDTFSRGSINNATGTYGYYTWEDGVRHNNEAGGKNQGIYFQDAWRVTSRISLNLGVRLENEFLPPYSKEFNGTRGGQSDHVQLGRQDCPAHRRRLGHHGRRQMEARRRFRHLLRRHEVQSGAGLLRRRLLVVACV